MKRLVSILLVLAMAVTTIGYKDFAVITTVNANEVEENTNETPNEEAKVENVIKGDYFRQYMEVLKKQEMISVGENTLLEDGPDGKGIFIKGTKTDLLNEKIVIDKTFDFNSGVVGRFSIDALSLRGTTVTLGFYLDDNEEAFATTNLRRQKKKNVWSYSKDISIDVYDQKITGEHKLSIKVLDASADDVTIYIRSIEFVKSTVPVVYFNIDEEYGSIAEMNADYEHNTECYGTMTLQVPDGYKSEYSNKTQKTETYTLDYIRGRGNSTWGREKKPYKIKLENKANLLGMGSNKHWVLLANAYDNSMLRNRITYWAGTKLGMEFTPKSVPVDVIMNGEYYGSYCLSEQIRVGKTRVNIDDLEDNEEVMHSTDPAIISGGYLLALSPYGDDDMVTFETKRDIAFGLESPELIDYYNEAQFNYIKNYVQKIEDAIYSKNFTGEDGVSYKDLMDIKTAAYYYIMQDFSLNGDGFGTSSTYLYKARDGKLCWGPLWDFDYVAWGSTEYSGAQVEGWYHSNAVWFDKMFTDPDFIEEIRKAWDDYKVVMEELVQEGGQLDIYKAEMKDAAEYNFEKWDINELRDAEYWEDEEEQEEKVELTYDYEIERLRDWIKARLDWVNNNIETLIPQECVVKYVADGKLVAETNEYVGKTFQNMPQAPKKKGYEFIQWVGERTFTFEEYLEYLGISREEFEEYWGEEEKADIIANGYTETYTYDKYDIVPGDITLTAEYLSEDEIVQPKKLIFDRNEVTVTIWSDFEIPYTLLPYDTTIPRLEWSSSNEEVAKVDNGYIETINPGDAVITAKTQNGIVAKCTIHVVSWDDVEDGYDDEGYFDLQSDLKMNIGDVKKITPTFDSNKVLYRPGFKYITTNCEVADVEPTTGVITAYSEGEATIIVISPDGNYVNTCKVCVGDNSKAYSIGDKFTVKNVTYKVTDTDKVSCIGFKKSYKNKATKLVVPASVKAKKQSYKVTDIADNAFANCKKLSKVTIGKNIAFIGKKAFYNCSKIKKISIPKSVQIIYGQAFANNKKLTKVVFKGSETKVNKKAFDKINKKVTIKVPKNAVKFYKVTIKNKKIVK